MKPFRKKNLPFVAVLLVLFMPCVVIAGELEPAGPPTSGTMKTLDEVEARIPIKPADMPKLINASGSYYLTGNFTASSATYGIFVTVNNITIDLNGYTLDGNSVGTDAIQLDAGIKYTAIRNGYIKNWAGAGVNGEESTNTFVEKVHVESTTNEGIFLGTDSSAADCTVTSCNVGIQVGNNSIVTRCTAINNTNDGFTSGNNCVTAECTASGNGNSGLEKAQTHAQVEPRIPIPASSTPAGVFTITQSGSYYLQGNRSCSGTGIQVDADDVTIDLMGYTLKGPDTGTNYGVSMSGRSNVEIRNGAIRDFRYGIYEDSISGKNHRVVNVRAVSNTVSGIILGESPNEVNNCTVSENGTSASVSVYGIFTGSGSTVTGNTVYDNGLSATGGGSVYGILTASGSTVTGNTASNNGDTASGKVYGIFTGTGSTVTGNTVYNNGVLASDDVFGIYLSGSNLVDQNTVYNNAEGASGIKVNMDLTIPNCVYGVNLAPNVAP